MVFAWLICSADYERDRLMLESIAVPPNGAELEVFLQAPDDAFLQSSPN